VVVTRRCAVEFVGRGGRERRIGGRIVLGVGGRPQWRAAGGRAAGWRRRLTEVGEDGAHGGGVGDEGDDADFAPVLRARQRANFIDAGEQQRPGIAGGAGHCRRGPVSGGRR